MIGLGTIVNTLAILAGSAMGLVLRKGLPEKWQETIMYSLALCIGVIGAKMAFMSENIIIVVASLVLGAILGECLDLEKKLNSLGNYLGKKIAAKKGSGTVSKTIAEGFITASLIYCVGAMAIVGTINDGLKSDPSVLFAKATLDGITAIIFTANMGIGVAFSALSVLIYQGFLTLLAGFLAPYMTAILINEISATGGVMIMAIGINMLKIAKIRIANMLPGIIFVPIILKIVQIFSK